MKLHELYQAILASLNVKADDQGLLSLEFDPVNNPGEEVVALVNKHRLVLPTPALLKQGRWEEHGLQPFHPLAEHIGRGESPVMRKLRHFVQLRLLQQYIFLINLLTTLCANREMHDQIAPKGAGVLKLMPKADQQTVEVVDQILTKAMDGSPANLLKVFIRRGGLYNGVKTPRVCVVRFPLIEEFVEGGNEVLGVKLRKKDYTAIRNLLEYITPDAELITTYGAGSVSAVAPTLDCLLQAYAKTAKHFNSLIHLYRKHTDVEDTLKVNLDWVEYLPKLDDFRGHIPPLPGNEGDLNESKQGAEVQMSHTPVSIAKIARNSPEFNSRSTTEARVAEATGSAVESDTERSTDDSDYERSVDKVSQALKALQTRTVTTPPPPTTTTTPAREGRSFQEMMAERNRSMQNPYGNAAPVYTPVSVPAGYQIGQPMIQQPQASMPSYYAQPVQPAPYYQGNVMGGRV